VEMALFIYFFFFLFTHFVSTAVDRCPNCVTVFDGRGSLKQHMRVCRGNGLYPFFTHFASTAADRCPNCVMLFDQRGTRKQHMRVRRGIQRACVNSGMRSGAISGFKKKKKLQFGH
jgi:predicted dithiol-disulfide oxidoreductase (DUF899 family)